jgi:tetratricopeptide (TPR) repeat protein
MQYPQRVLSGGLAILVAGALCGVTGCNKLKARDLLNQGIEAYKVAQFDQSEEDFKQAAELDPKLINARVYLATAYASQYVPGGPSPENVRRGQQAITEYKKVLDQDPQNLSALDGIGSVLYQMASNPFDPDKLAESKQYHERHIQIKPGDAQPYYWVAVIDWTLAHTANSDMRHGYNDSLGKQKRRKPAKPITEEEALPDNLRQQFADKYGQVVDEGIDYCQKAVQINPDYADAYAYLNLLYRQKADMVESAPERQDLIKKANDLVDKVKEIKEKEAEAPKSS